MQMTAPQRRTLEQLIGVGERPLFPADLRQRLVDRIEDAVRGLELREPLWLGKEKVTDHGRCEGKFQASILGEGPPFEHNARSAVGVLLHRAIEVEVGSRDDLDPHAVAVRAADRLVESEARFAEYWRTLSVAEHDEVLMDVVRRVVLFRASFPSLRDLRSDLAPITELPAKAELLGGTLTLSGRIDLVLGLPRKAEPARAMRLAIDLKTGGAYPEYAEDMRLYALLMTLRFGVPPYRVASLFLDSGEWQAEEVTEETLFHAADRVVGGGGGGGERGKGWERRWGEGGACV
jgi:hypothetical protein